MGVIIVVVMVIMNGLEKKGKGVGRRDLPTHSLVSKLGFVGPLRGKGRGPEQQALVPHELL